MARAEPSDERTDALHAGLITGLISGTVSTLVVSLGARRIGRDAPLDWMEAGTVLLRDDGIRVDPGWREILAGIAVHQSADLAWAAGFLGLGIGKFTHYRQTALLVAAVPWAVLTAAIEYYLILPWLQPILRRQVPFWTAVTVHICSASAYPLFFGVQARLRGYAASPTDENTTVSRVTAVGLTAFLLLLAVLSALAQTGRDFRWPFGSQDARAADRTFLRHMTAHHVLGVRLAKMALNNSNREDVRTLSRPMLGEHEAEIEVMRDWWRSWYGGEVPGITDEEYQKMPGMPPQKDLDTLDYLDGPAFDVGFLHVMTYHHEGAVQMSNRVIAEGNDPRIKLFADSIRHSQQNQIEWMRRLMRVAVSDAQAYQPADHV